MDALASLLPELTAWRGAAISVVHVALILVLAWLALRVSRKGLARLRLRMEHDVDDFERIKRLNTLEQVFRYVFAVLVIRMSPCTRGRARTAALRLSAWRARLRRLR